MRVLKKEKHSFTVIGTERKSDSDSDSDQRMQMNATCNRYTHVLARAHQQCVNT